MCTAPTESMPISLNWMSSEAGAVCRRATVQMILLNSMSNVDNDGADDDGGADDDDADDDDDDGCGGG